MYQQLFLYLLMQKTKFSDIYGSMLMILCIYKDNCYNSSVIQATCSSFTRVHAQEYTNMVNVH